MNISLAYGDKPLTISLPDNAVSITPRHHPGLVDERSAFHASMERPTVGPSLRELLKPGRRVCVVFNDITRPTPNVRMIPWVLEYLEQCGAADDRIVLLNATGTHRPNTRAELDRMLTSAVTARYNVVNHECEKEADLVNIGTTKRGTPIWINRHFMEADVRIVTGFIEPHFFAGFSGGPKGIMPGVAGLKTVMSNHGYGPIASEKATFGINAGNPVWEEMAEAARMAGGGFLINVTLNRNREITGVFSGELFAAHAAGTEAVRDGVMAQVIERFDIVITSNNGYPLDQNLYQAVKGLSAAARIVKPGGMIILAAECREGLPTGSPFERLLFGSLDIDSLLAQMGKPGFSEPEQWQAQIFGRILLTARVYLYSGLPDDVARRSHLTPCHDIGSLVQEQIRTQGTGVSIAVLPEGPMVIPYVKG